MGSTVAKEVRQETVIESTEVSRTELERLNPAGDGDKAATMKENRRA
jgi:hypothetical protein